MQSDYMTKNKKAYIAYNAYTKENVRICTQMRTIWQQWLKATKISNIKVKYLFGDIKKTNHCNLKLNCKILCTIKPSQCTFFICAQTDKKYIDIVIIIAYRLRVFHFSFSFACLSYNN
jgi:hypothetical protein